ncbi:copper resistance CopC family protein [Actinophytocola sp.]|uniref:copper resistance CopC family protein n=1 Tax=Actinophytocola sp. TaxID=1872138 RepID=UPI003D6A01B6
MRRLAAVLVLVGLTLLGLATPAVAHNSLVGSNPADKATVRSSPSNIELTFDQPVQKGDGLNTISVAGPSNTGWKTGPVNVASNVVSASLDELGPAGAYRISYRIVSADGHPVSGELEFTLANAGSGTSTTTATAEEQDGGLPIWVWIVGAVVVLGAGLTVAMRIGGKQPR